MSGAQKITKRAIAIQLGAIALLVSSIIVLRRVLSSERAIAPSQVSIRLTCQEEAIIDKMPF
ncbi:hypothetical protein IQ270_12415 [Microcoleus sp. LEGE 07076]|uniref:hypothetical protein n=1 Tax=Microcoleus sp. LEGE 07076 TaxID=915322 RepID=UPI001880B0F8|nr:hypothetical protein [Microcoleus sp. LEGE 07076]MBE9185486.1 hypothetical protein [Microcoleus sp. LEGE 07076]